MMRECQAKRKQRKRKEKSKLYPEDRPVVALYLFLLLVVEYLMHFTVDIKILHTFRLTQSILRDFQLRKQKEDEGNKYKLQKNLFRYFHALKL
ncbi:CLUMA_CG021080, isoform A [Clunio marinus]|uniref:CLUMA_CG021080, isoform A n=1 Tax=Clunio marinus TaxID=568069 RepID=A0A1J1J8U2_9DIPT|nr:CLUMA_CG021080, isoform A [Clunio marinus]